MGEFPYLKVENWWLSSDPQQQCSLCLEISFLFPETRQSPKESRLG